MDSKSPAIKLMLKFVGKCDMISKSIMIGGDGHGSDFSREVCGNDGSGKCSDRKLYVLFVYYA